MVLIKHVQLLTNYFVLIVMIVLVKIVLKLQGLILLKMEKWTILMRSMEVKIRKFCWGTRIFGNVDNFIIDISINILISNSTSEAPTESFSFKNAWLSISTWPCQSIRGSNHKPSNYWMRCQRNLSFIFHFRSLLIGSCMVPNYSFCKGFLLWYYKINIFE